MELLGFLSYHCFTEMFEMFDSGYNYWVLKGLH